MVVSNLRAFIYKRSVFKHFPGNMRGPRSGGGGVDEGNPSDNLMKNLHGNTSTLKLKDYIFVSFVRFHVCSCSKELKATTRVILLKSLRYITLETSSEGAPRGL